MRGNLSLTRGPSPLDQQMYTAFEVFFNVWLNSKVAKLRCAVVEALGIMSHILEREKLEMLLPNVIPGMLNLLKKYTSEMLPITQVCLETHSRLIASAVG